MNSRDIGNYIKIMNGGGSVLGPGDADTDIEPEPNKSVIRNQCLTEHSTGVGTHCRDTSVAKGEQPRISG